MFLAIMYIDGGEGGGSGDPAGGEGGGDPAGGGDLLAGKYKSQEDLVTGYTELQSAFSGKDEAHLAELAGLKSPDAYNPAEDWGNDNPMDNRLMSVLQAVGKEFNMPQGMYESLFNEVTGMQQRVTEDSLNEVKKSIPNFDNRANAIVDTALRFLRPDQAKGLDSLMDNKESFEAVEILMGQLRGGQLPPTTPPAEDVSDAELRSQLNKLNPADTKKRDELMGILNKRGGGQGKMV